MWYNQALQESHLDLYNFLYVLEELFCATGKVIIKQPQKNKRTKQMNI